MEGLKRHLEIISKFSDPDKILPKIKNQAGREPGNFAVDQRFVEPLIDYALFMPKTQFINFEYLIFPDVFDFKTNFPIIVRNHLKDYIHIR